MADRVPLLFRLGAWLEGMSVRRARERALVARWRGEEEKAAGSDHVVTLSGTTWDPERGLFGEEGRYSYRWAATAGYGHNELVYAIVSDIAESAAEPSMQVVVDDEPVDDHPARGLLARPNGLMTEFELWELVLLHLMLAGNAFWLKVRSRAGRVVELWPVWTPSRMVPVPDAEGVLRGWVYTDNEGGRHPVDSEDVVHFKYQNPLNPYLGLAPMAVLVRAVDRDNKSTDYVNAFFANAAVPQGLLKFKKYVEQGEADRVRAMWRARYGGERGWFDVAVLDADTEYQRLGLTADEMAMPELNQLNESRIAMVFKWPPILVGAIVGLENSPWSNIGEARKIAWQDTLSPIYKRLADRCNLGLAEDFGFEVTDRPFRWDFGRVLALQEDVDALAERMRDGFVAGGVTRNEYRQALGLDEEPGGDVYLVNPGLVPVGQGSGKGAGGQGAGEKVWAWPVWERVLRGRDA